MTADAKFWDTIAEKYSRQPVANPDAFERKIAVTKGYLEPEHIVLEVGCGTGSLALRLAGSVAKIHALDISSEMIRIAREKTAKAHIDNVIFHVGPFDDSFDALAPGSVDVLCAYSILHLVYDLPATLARMFGLLKPGGVLVSSTACLGGTLVPYRTLIAVMRAFGKAPKVLILSKAELAREIEKAGFVDLIQPEVGVKADVAFMVAKKPG
jgi:arsenite methyltransferase